MTNQKLTPLAQRAFDFIKNNLDQKVWSFSGPIPPIRALAQKIGVSKSTVATAMDQAIKRGMLSPEAQKKRWTSEPHDALTARCTTVQWKRKREVVEKEIVAGVIGTHGILPTVKEMQSRYHLCFRSMQKILRSMEADGVIEPCGKGHMLAGFSGQAGQKSILFITIRNYLAQESALNHEHNRIANLFENECLHRNLHLKVIEVDFYDALESRKAIASIKNSDSILGFIVDIWWDDTKNVRQGYIDLLARLAPYKKPMALLDEFGDFVLPVEFSINPFLQVYRIEGKRAGERVARYCMGLGHQRAAYISLTHYSSEWSPARFQGVQTQFERAGMTNAINLFTNESITMLLHHFALSNLDEADINHIIASGRTPAQAQDLARQWNDFKKSLPAALLNIPGDVDGLRKNLAGLRTILQYGFDEDFVAKIMDAIFSASGTRSYKDDCNLLFKNALSEKDITVWICANDGIAFNALSFLRAQAVPVPGAISVIGFDNTPTEALENRLTSFDFNAAGFVHQMLNFIARPTRPRGAYKHEAIEVQGMIIERESTGKAKPK
jgi:DNA-binding LacI/PurR family transcriptional regulator/DNA-binding transcriptional regulator YhcF (GntR family)